MRTGYGRLAVGEDRGDGGARRAGARRNRDEWLPAARSHRATAVVSRSRSLVELASMAVALTLAAALAVTGLGHEPTWHDGDDCRGVGRETAKEQPDGRPAGSTGRRPEPCHRPPNPRVGIRTAARSPPEPPPATKPGRLRRREGGQEGPPAKKPRRRHLPRRPRRPRPPRRRREEGPAKKAAKAPPEVGATCAEARRHQRRPRVCRERGCGASEVDRGQRAAIPSPILRRAGGPEPSRLPIAAAVAAGVLAILVVLLVRRGSDED